MNTASSIAKPPNPPAPAGRKSQLVDPLLGCVRLMIVVTLFSVEISKADGPDGVRPDPINRDNAQLQQGNSKATIETGSQDPVDTRLSNEVHCLALNIYFEARSEPEIGQRAVGHVVMNRVAHPAYPDSVCQVVRQGGEEALHRCQFSWWCDGRSDRPVNRKAWDQSLRLAREIYLGLSEDTTDGALWYHATYVKPYWSEILLKGNRIGQHIFYHENQRPRKTL